MWCRRVQCGVSRGAVWCNVAARGGPGRAGAGRWRGRGAGRAAGEDWSGRHSR